MEKRNLNKTNRFNRAIIIGIVGIFLFYLLLMLVNINIYWGFTDENDNFAGGLVIASGGVLYKDYFSQHMPLMYLICALYKILGADTDWMNRFYFYITLAGIFTAIFYRYKQHFDKRIIFLFPIFYIINMGTFYNCVVVADHLQAIGMAIIFLELLLYFKRSIIDTSTMIWTSFAVFISFGSAFVAIFAIFIAAVGVFVMECMRYSWKKTDFMESCKKIFFTFTKFCAIAVLPFMGLLLYLIQQGTVKDLYRGAFVINTQYYAKYMNGYGSNITNAFAGVIDGFFGAVNGCFSEFFNTPQIQLKILLSLIVFIIYILYKKLKPIQSAILVMFVLLCGQRGFGYEFHSMPYYMLAMIMLSELLTELGKTNLKKWRYIAIIIVGFILFSPYLSHFSQIFSSVEVAKERAVLKEGQQEYYINKLLEPDEKYYLANVNITFGIRAQRMSLPNAVSVPWMYEAYKKQELKTLTEYKPKVIIYYPEYEIWGYKISDYAPEVAKYIKDNYIKLSIDGINDLYISNIYYDEAIKKLKLRTINIEKEILEYKNCEMSTKDNENHLMGKEDSAVIYDISKYKSKNNETIDIVMDVEENDTLQIFFATQKGDFDEARSVSIPIYKGKGHYTISMEGYENSKYLRIDFINKKQSIDIIDVSILRKTK